MFRKQIQGHTHKPHQNRLCLVAHIYHSLSLGLIIPLFLPKLRNHSLTSILVWLILVRPTRESISIPLTPCSSAVSVVLLEFRTPEGLTNNESLGCTRCKSRENQGSFTACFWSCAYTPAAYLAAVQPKLTQSVHIRHLIGFAQPMTANALRRVHSLLKELPAHCATMWELLIICCKSGLAPRIMVPDLVQNVMQTFSVVPWENMTPLHSSMSFTTH